MPPKRACKHGPRRNGKCPPAPAAVAASPVASPTAASPVASPMAASPSPLPVRSQSPARPDRLRIHVTVSSGGAVLSKDDVEFIQARVAEAKVAMLKELEAMYDDAGSSNNNNKAQNAAADKASGGFLARLKAAATSRPAIVGAMILALAGGAFAAHKTGYLTLEQARVLAEMGRATGRRLAAGVRAGVRSARNKAAARLAKGWAWAGAQARRASNAVSRRLRRRRASPPPQSPPSARFASMSTSSLAAKLGLGKKKK